MKRYFTVKLADSRNQKKSATIYKSKPMSIRSIDKEVSRVSDELLNILEYSKEHKFNSLFVSFEDIKE